MRILLPLLLVVLAALASSWPALQGSFVYDDAFYVGQNEAVQGQAALLSTPLGEPVQGLWRPLTVASYRMQWSPGTGARPFLALNLGLHSVCALLVFWLCVRLTRSRAAALVAALLFAIHPVHAEAVAWVSGRAELLATAFVLAAWISYLRPGRGATAAAVIFTLLGGLSKENALAAPALFVVTDLVRARQRLPWGRLGLLALAVVVVLGARLALLEHAVPGHGPFREAPLAVRGVVALNVMSWGYRLLAWPHPLRIEYHRDELTLLEPGGLGPLLAALALVVLLWSRRREAALGLLLVPVALLPVMHLLPIGEPFAERFLYLPSVPFCLAVGVLVATLGRLELARSGGLGASVLLTLALLAGGTLASRQAVKAFHDDTSLWHQAVAAAPQLAVPHYNLGRVLAEAGRYLPQDRDRPGALDAMRDSLALEPRHTYSGYAHELLGDAGLGAVGSDPPHPMVAGRHYRAALERLPLLTAARINLASLALSAPRVISTGEAQALLRPLANDPTLTSGELLLVDDLLRQLSEATSASSGESGDATGTSSDDGS